MRSYRKSLVIERSHAKICHVIFTIDSRQNSTTVLHEIFLAFLTLSSDTKWSLDENLSRYFEYKQTFVIWYLKRNCFERNSYHEALDFVTVLCSIRQYVPHNEPLNRNRVSVITIQKGKTKRKEGIWNR